MAFENRNYAFTTTFVDELVRAGLRHVVICPGSRSTPVAIAFARNDRIKKWVHLDERSAGFFALGMALALEEPVAVLVTSGSAAARGARRCPAPTGCACRSASAGSSSSSRRRRARERAKSTCR